MTHRPPPQALERLCALSIVLCATAVKAGLDEGRLPLAPPRSPLYGESLEVQANSSGE
jgi:hypothetical protein